MILAWWQLATLAFIVVIAGKVLLVAYRNGWGYLPERSRELWWTRPRPLMAWRSQDVWQRRRQALVGLAVAAVVAMLMAVALRGIFVLVFLLMVLVLVVALLFAAARGAVELRRGPQSVARQLADLGPDVGLQTGPYAETGIFADRGGVPKLQVGSVDGPPPSVDSDETPLMFEPLGIDPSPGRTVPAAEESPEDDRLHDTTESGMETHGTDDLPPNTGGEAGVKPSFSAAPDAGRRQASARARSRKRSKARPIYIESTLDGEEPDDLDGGQGRVVGGR